jgi:hypothetical protein
LQGSVLTEAAKVREVTIKERLIADAELIDEISLENARALQHMK